MPYKNAADKVARDAAYHAERAKQRNRRSNARRRYKLYGVTELQVRELWEAQGRCCAICDSGIALVSRNTHLDHCHKTKKVRGLLCRRCNFQLGHYEKWPEFARYAAVYLERANVV